MSKKLCTAGVRGSYSYVILNGDKVISNIEDDDDPIAKATHIDMDVAERWVDNHLQTLIGKQYEVD